MRWMLVISSIFWGACGKDSAVPVDGRLQLDDAFGTGIDAAIDATPATFPVTCLGTMTTRQGPDKFDDDVRAGTGVLFEYTYDPGTPDENPDPNLYEATNLGMAEMMLTFRVQGTDAQDNPTTQWVFSLDADARCTLTLANDQPANDELVVDCAMMAVGPVIAGETQFGVKLTITDPTKTLFSASLPDGAIDVTSVEPDAIAAFELAGTGWTWNGTFGSCNGP